MALKLRIYLFLTVLLLVSCAVVRAAEPASLFDEAAKAYEAENFALAIEKYEELTAAGYGGGVVYYNLGNAYFRAGDLGMAIMNYRRAQRIMPRDEELRENLEYCRALVIDDVKTATTPGPWKFARQALKRFSMNELALAASSLFAAAMLLAVLAVLTGASRPKLFIRRMSWLLLLLSIGLGSATGYIVYEDTKTPAVVVLKDRLEVLAGPGDDFSAIFILHEGAEATILRSRGEWRQILFPSAGRGWVPRSAIEKI